MGVMVEQIHDMPQRLVVIQTHYSLINLGGNTMKADMNFAGETDLKKVVDFSGSQGRSIGVEVNMKAAILGELNILGQVIGQEGFSHVAIGEDGGKAVVAADLRKFLDDLCVERPGHNTLALLAAEGHIVQRALQ